MYICILSGLCYVCILTHAFISKSIINIWFYEYLLWLGSIAYIDRVSGYVFCVMEYYAILPVTAVIISYCVIRNNAGSGMLVYLFVNAVYILIMLFLSKKGVFGEGDADILSTSSVIISAMVYERSDDFYVLDIIVANIQFFTVSSFIFLLYNLKNISWKSMKLKEAKPFVPSIYITYIIYYFTFLLK